jgi:hypothetical protein
MNPKQEHELQAVQKIILREYNTVITNIVEELEGKIYCAHSFSINDWVIKYRSAKITPTKTGQFVTLWRRNEHGKTTPYNVSDAFDKVIISTSSGENFGCFVFPKSILIEKGIVTNEQKEGKRGFRVYPPWDLTTNNQAIKTQQWQLEFFKEEF